MKNTYRFFVTENLSTLGLVNLTEPDLLRQWQSVLRFKPGQVVTLLDGVGSVVQAELLQLSKHQAQLRITEQLNQTHEPSIYVTLCVGLIRPERFEWMLQKGTELGASAFMPLITERSIRDTVSTNKHNRWQRIIREAAEQSERTRLPQLHEPQTLAASFALVEQGFFLAETGAAVDMQTALAMLPTTCGIWAGPEGGWSDSEIAAAHTADITATRLGKRILRAETAPLAALSAVMFMAGEWSN